MYTRARKRSFRPYLWLITLVSVIVPSRFRSDWRQEWEAELRYREALLEEWEKLNWRTKLDLLRRSLGSFWDALWFQRQRLEEEMFQDIRFGMRMLGRSPIFTAVAVMSLALGIGANTAIFSLVNAVLLKKLPVKNPDQLVLLNWVSGKDIPAKSISGNLHMKDGQALSTSFSYSAFQQFRDFNEAFSDVFAFTDAGQLNVGIDGEAELAEGQLVSGGYYDVLGVKPIMGRALTADDDRLPGAEPVVVISYAYWQGRFGHDPAVVGKIIYINNSPFTIIGVTPQGFSGTLQVGSSPELTMPIAAQPLISPIGSSLDKPDYWWLQIIGRLKPGVSEQQARAGLDVIFQRSVAESQQSSDEKTATARLETSSGSRGLSESRQEFSEPLFILMAVVGLVLAIACANIANLLLARAATRQKEIAVRLALGASRLRLIRQLLTESVLLAFIGGALGLLFAYLGKDLLLTLLPEESTSFSLDLSMDARILSFTAAISILTGILFGLAPALRATRVDLTPALKDNARSMSKGKSRLGKVLLVAQVAMSLLLLIGAGLFVRTLQNLENVDLGFNRENVLLFKLDPTLNGYKGPRLMNLYKQIMERVEALPGVQSASLSSHAPISNNATYRSVEVEGYTPPEDAEKYVYQQSIADTFFDTMEIPLLLGRGFNSKDDENAPKVAVINETMARTYFSSDNPVGRLFSIGRKNKEQVEVIGMVKDVKYTNVRQNIPPTFYMPYLQRPNDLGRVSFEVRTSGNPTEMVAAIRQVVQEADKNLPLFDVKTQSEQVNATLAQERLFARLSSFFGLLALMLACIGLYGLMSYAVARRTHEIGIRMALGARSGDVLWMVMREILMLVLIGVAIGLPAALAATRLISSMLFGLTATDPMTISVATLFMIAVAALAGYIPARRASRVDPMVALRYE
jgi:predicted permease